MTRSLALMIVLGAAAPAGAAAPKCAKGQHLEHEGSHFRCVTDKFVSNAGAMHGAAQDAERKGWKDYDAAMAKYKNEQGALGIARTRRDGAQYRLEHTPCMQFACGNQEAQGAVETHEAQMNAAQNRMGDAASACKRAAGEIEAARAKEKAERLPFVSNRVPSCPNAGGGFESYKCPKGMQRHFGKCVRTNSPKPAH